MRKIIRKILWVAAFAVFLFSAVMLWRYQAAVNQSADAVDALVQLAVRQNPQAPESDDNEETDFSSGAPKEDTTLRESAPIAVDFEALLQQNSDIVAWIYCPDTPINYPIVQSQDNRFYLRRLINGSWNFSGTLFLDYRNAENFSDVNSVIYGHNMSNGTMFGTLKNYKNQEYYEKHPVLYLLTPEKDYKVELLAGFIAPSDAALYDISELKGKTAEEIMALVESSDFTAETDLSSKDRLLTLSTCSNEYDNARYVLIGVLKELEK